MNKDLSHLKHITDPDLFYRGLSTEWLETFNPNDGSEGDFYIQSMELLDSLAVESYRAFCLFDIKDFKVIHFSPRIYELMQYTKEELDKAGPSFFMKLMVGRHFTHWLKLLFWLKKSRSLEPHLKAETFSMVYKGFRFKKKSGEEVSTLIRQVVPAGHFNTRLTILELFDTSHLIDDNHFTFRIQSAGENKAIGFHHTKRAYSKMDDLFTRREFEILFQMAKGKSTQEIADELFISHRTVSTHKRNMLDKTGANNASSMLEICKMMGINGL